MSTARAAVVALSNSEQQRETLVIMLDEVFDVAAADTPRARPRSPAPAAVVVAPRPWDEDLARQARRRWPAAGLVLVDPPAAPAPAEERLACASWDDPYSLPVAVARVASRPHPAPPSDRELAHAVRRADLALRPALDQAQTLAALARAARRPISVEIACRLLAEHLIDLDDRLAWSDWFALDADGSDRVADLAGALRAALEARQGRLRARDLEVAWERESPAYVPCGAGAAAVLAAALRAAILELPPGTLRVEAGPATLALRHPGLGEAFAWDVAGCLARRAGLRLRSEPGVWTMESESEDDADHA